MLLIAHSLKELSFDKLMELYKSDNLERASKEYPNLSPYRGLERIEDEFYSYLQDGFFRQRGARYFILMEEDRYISAMRIEPYLDGVLINALETALDYRRQGYGELLFRQSLSLLNNEGAGKVYSHIYRNNKASSNLHKKCGFTLAYPYARFLDGTTSSAADTYVHPFEA